MRGRRNRVVIKGRSLQSLEPILSGLLKINHSRRLITRRERRERISKSQRISLMLLSSIRIINYLFPKRREGLKRDYALFMVESRRLKNASSGLRIGQVHQEASVASREKSEWEQLCVQSFSLISFNSTIVNSEY
ncbi:hypothetical protein O181_022881 [Austropuccinia psidii MF-1]|uniref:Uncharacterized protein n=1 Tax=Austropuccinia psidii MF-1 TaxID=1389203 RepID=A0A9Q3CDS4_9BASI|nr:hypothetical protein [Austropuccinia psidii MF-1]